MANNTEVKGDSGIPWWLWGIMIVLVIAGACVSGGGGGSNNYCNRCGYPK